MLQRKLQRKFSILRIIIILFSLIFFFLALIYYLFTFFEIDNIVIKSENRNKTIQGIELIENKNLILLDTNKVQKLLETSNPALTNITINKHYPRSVSIEYELDEEIAYIKSNDGYFYLSKSAKILNKSKELLLAKDLTELVYYQSFDYVTNPVGSRLDFLDIRYSLSFLNYINNYGFEAESIDIDSPNMIRLNLNEATVIVTTEKGIGGQLVNLEKIIKQFKVEGKSFSLLDLRFDKPILKLN